MKASMREWLESIGQMLDGLGIAMCLFDLQDCTVLWNNHFLCLFPEHAEQVHEGEPYRANLLRFYRGRLHAQELVHIDRYIDEGIARHHDQAQPYEFEHRGQRLRVASLQLEGVGRMRLWCPRAAASAGAGEAPQSGDPLPTADLLDRVPSGLMLCDDAGRIQWVNAPFVQMYCLANAQAAQGQTLAAVFRAAWERAGDADAPACRQHLSTLRERMRFTGAPFELPLPHQRCCRVVAQPGHAGGHLYAHTDITELQRKRERLAQAERAARESAAQLERESTLLQATLAHMEQGVAMVNAQGRVEYCNQRALDLLDLPRELLAGQPLVVDVIRYQYEHGEFADQPPEALERLLAHAPDRMQPLVVRQRPNGCILEVRSIPVPGGGMLRTFTDVTERHQQQQRMEHLASHDGLTGLLNRNKFMDTLASEVALAGRTQQRFAVLYLDLDGFKPINDTHGHAAGDRVLVEVAQTLRRVARSSDFIARLGGDEFALLQRGIDTPAQAAALAERLDAALRHPVALGHQSVAVGASVGIALYPEHGEDPEALLAHADQAMYLAKAGTHHGGTPAQARHDPGTAPRGGLRPAAPPGAAGAVHSGDPPS